MRDRKEGYQGLYADAHHNTTYIQNLKGKSRTGNLFLVYEQQYRSDVKMF
jgi:hypothetical protein